MSNVGAEYKKYQGVSDLATQSAIFYVLKARVASGLENNEEGSEKISDTMSKAWIDAAFNADRLAENDPRQALELGLMLTTLPQNDGSKEERVYRWMRGDGPVILAKESIREELLEFLKSDPRALSLVSKVSGFMGFDGTSLGRKEVFSEGNCFLALASMYLGAKLGTSDNNQANQLNRMALERLSDSKVAGMVRYYATEEDTSWIMGELAPFLPRIILKTDDDSVELRQLVPEDAEEYFSLVDLSRNDQPQFRGPISEKYLTVEAVRESITKPRNSCKFRFGIWDNGVMVGSNNLTPLGENRAEIGDWVAKKHLGHNYAVRAGVLLVDFAFNQLQLDELIGLIDVGNNASRRTAEKSGFKLVETFKDKDSGVLKWKFVLKNPNK
ncbi:MAG: GCN5-related N-acetyltransferase [Microgenomates group bacterium GW2011_GWA2_40_6]|nr:MAG: GCN5-related N-acetyltransferase [Microgenomates group bacterium GW2011_GWA2_40_6]